MGLFNFFKEVCDPGAISDFNDLVNNHREALDNWVRGGYRPRVIIPKNERVPFNEYDNEYDYISSRLSKPRWILGYEEMSYEQKSFIAGRKQQILSLYAIFHKYEQKVSEIAKIAEQYPYGFNAIAIKYGKFRINNLYVEPFNILKSSNKQIDSNKVYSISDALKRLNSITTETSFNSSLFSLDFSSYATAQVVDTVHQLTPEQCSIILSHMDELRSENTRLNQKHKEEQEAKTKKKEKELIDKAVFLANCYPRAYKELFNYPLEKITSSKAEQILEKEDVIRATEKKRREEESSLRKKEEEKRNLATILPACVKSWRTHSNSTIKHMYFYDYYSYADNKDTASQSIRDTWRIIWHFKNDPDKNVSDSDHKQALRTVTLLVEDALRSAFGSKTEYLTLVCLTASTRRKTEMRYNDFAEIVCKDLNMINAYPHIRVTEDGNAKHDGGDGSHRVYYDSYFFNGKYVVLFDDVRTTGNSLEQERRTLEGFGAKVICAVTIAQTTH